MPLSRMPLLSYRGFVAIFLLFESTGCSNRVESSPGGRFDIGQVFAEQTSHVQHAFSVKNTTGRPARILRVRASCACATRRLDKYQLEPGESTNLVISAPVLKTHGKAALFCTLETDDLKFKEWDYALYFESIPRLMVSPVSFHLGAFKVSDFDVNGQLKRSLEPAVFMVDVFSLGQDMGNPTLSLPGGVPLPLQRLVFKGFRELTKKPDPVP